MSMIHCLENSGFQLVDTLLDYCVDYRITPFSSITEPKKTEDIVIRFAKPEDEKELEDLAKGAFKSHFGRFHADQHFTFDQATEVYVEWMRSSLRGYADYFILAEIEGRIAGLSIWKKTSQAEEQLPVKISHYSIGAVHPDFFGKGLFTRLTYEGMKLFNGKTDLIEGPTHINNYAVQRGYTRLNWQIYDARHSFHKWLD
jgi:GNAT superfamily N-acetyltransferase